MSRVKSTIVTKHKQQILTVLVVRKIIFIIEKILYLPTNICLMFNFKLFTAAFHYVSFANNLKCLSNAFILEKAIY